MNQPTLSEYESTFVVNNPISNYAPNLRTLRNFDLMVDGRVAQLSEIEWQTHSTIGGMEVEIQITATGTDYRHQATSPQTPVVTCQLFDNQSNRSATFEATVTEYTQEYHPSEGLSDEMEMIVNRQHNPEVATLIRNR